MFEKFYIFFFKKNKHMGILGILIRFNGKFSNGGLNLKIK
jgi:hypothetical protein